MHYIVRQGFVLSFYKLQSWPKGFGTVPSPFPKTHAQVKSLRVLMMPTHSIFDALYPYHLQSGFSQNEDPVETNLYWS